MTSGVVDRQGTRRQAVRVLLALGLVGVLGSLALGWIIQLRTDMAAFLPTGGTPAQRFLLDQVRAGPAATLILIGLEGAPPVELARVSRAMAEQLAVQPAFRLVANGARGLDGSEQGFLMAHRYLLADVTTPEAFTTAALRANLERLLRELAGSTGMLAAKFGFDDPPGAFLALAKTWLGGTQLRLQDGVWFAAQSGGQSGAQPGAQPDERALLLVRTVGEGLDIERQRQAVTLVRDAFTATGTGARLLLSGPGVFAVEAERSIKRDAEFIAILSTIVVVVFLYWRHRSPLVLAAVLIVLGSGALAGALAVQAVFGFVHGITLGFGMTMLGIAADYPLLVIGQRRPAESLHRAARRLGPTLGLAIAATALGLVVMLMSSFPGLAQLGLFSVAGLVMAGLATRFVLPRLVGPITVRDQSAAPFWLAAADVLRQHRRWLLLPVGSALVWLVYQGGPGFTIDLARLSPISQASQDLDETLRRQLGAPDVRYLVAIEGADEEAVLQAAERLDGVLGPLTERGALGSYDLPSHYLPSQAVQRQRQAALPTPAVLQARLAAAQAGLPFKDDAFVGFLTAVEASRSLPPVTSAAFASAALSARLAPLLVRSGTTWYGVATLADVRDAPMVALAIAALGDPELTYIDIKGETERLVLAYQNEAFRWLAAGVVALLVVLGLILRSAASVAKVTLPAVGAAVVAMAIPSLAGTAPTLFNLVSLLLMVGVSIDYGLFLNRGDADARALGSALNCNAATLLTFGLLAWCRNPVLSGIGVTVATGVLAGLVLAVALSQAPALANPQADRAA